MCLLNYLWWRFPLSLELLVYLVEQRTVLYCFYTTIIGEILELKYLETLKKTRFKIWCYQKQYRHSFRTVADSLKEHNPHTTYFTYVLSFILFFCFIDVYILINRHTLCQTYFYWRELYISCKMCFRSYCIYSTREICLNNYPNIYRVYQNLSKDSLYRCI